MRSPGEQRRTQIAFFDGEINLENVGFLDFVEDQIKQVDERMLSRASGHHPELGAALEHLLSSGGKRVRPTLTILMGRLLSADEDDLITLGASIELLHTATLVHDDLIDGALLRRGNPTLNSDWSPAATVLTGDYIFAQAAELAADISSPEIMALFARTLTTIVNGEVRQLFNRQGVTTLDEYYRRIYEKTGSMFVLATHAAALLSEADEQSVDAAKHYGDAVGKAFQIVDDVLDFAGDENRMGKPVGSDLQQGVLTLPTLFYLQSNPDDPALSSVMGGQDNGQLVEKVISAIKRSDAIERSLAEARKYSREAQQALEGLPEGKEKQALKQLAEFIVERQN